MSDFAEALDPQLWARVMVALLCGGMVGLERQLRGKPAGMRTSSLICLGTMIFVYLGIRLEGPTADPSRVLGQVIAGIGFLGAGVIMTRDGIVVGVTSAAVVWVLAAAGAAVGLGRYGLALSLSFVTVSVLVGVERLERMFGALRHHGQANDDDSRDEPAGRMRRTSGAPATRRE